MTQWGFVLEDGAMRRKMLRTFAAANMSRTEFRFHINSYKDFISFLNDYGYNSSCLEITNHEAPSGLKIKFVLKDKRDARDYQEKTVNYLVAPGKTKLVTLQTGKGKTFCGLRAMFLLSVRVVIVIKGMYVDKWKEDVKEAFNIKNEDLMIVRGSKHLHALIDLALAGELKAKVIIITNTTMYNYLYEYERFDGVCTYGVSPIDFYKTLNAGVRLIDEVHQDFHLNFRMDLYTHIEKTLNLSATMEPDDPFLKKMYELMFLTPERFEGIPFDKYISVKALYYSLNDPKSVKWKNWIRKSYSHVMLEQSIMRNAKILNNYLQLIDSVVKESFIKVMQPGQKMLIFAATVELCTVICNHLQKILPHLVINRYTSEDPYDFLLKSDISVSTLKSAGTAVDIPGLRITLMTDSINSGQANYQVLGRTRPLKDWADITPEFIYLVCFDIPKQLEYHEKKKVIFANKVLSHIELNTGIRI